MDREYQWNGCLVALADEAQFLDRDLLVFRVQWVNRTNSAAFIWTPANTAFFAGDRSIPIGARWQTGVGPVIYPGQRETVFLAVQGYRLEPAQ